MTNADRTPTTTEFELLGIQYRASMNGDQVAVEALDGSTWNRTHSLNVILEAQRRLAIDPRT